MFISVNTTIKTASEIAEALAEGQGLELDLNLLPVKAAKIAGFLKPGCWLSVQPGTPFNVYLAIAQAIRPGTGLFLQKDLSAEEVLRVSRKLQPGCDLILADDVSDDYKQAIIQQLPKTTQLYSPVSFLQDSINRSLTYRFIEIVSQLVELLPSGSTVEPPGGVSLPILMAIAKSLQKDSVLKLPSSLNPKSARRIIQEIGKAYPLAMVQSSPAQSVISERTHKSNNNIFFVKSRPKLSVEVGDEAKQPSSVR